MGCLRSIGCLVVLAAAFTAGWMFRERIPGFDRPAAPPVRVARGPAWQPLTSQGAERVRTALARLARPSGPVFVNVNPGDLAAFIYQQLSRQLPPSADTVEAAAFGEQLHLRASVKLSDLGGPKVLGPLAGFLGARERMQFAGVFHIVQPGLAEFQVQSIQLRELSVPEALIPRLLRQIGRGTRPAGVSDDALPLVVPRYIADVRVGEGKVTLYRTAP